MLAPACKANQRLRSTRTALFAFAFGGFVGLMPASTGLAVASAPPSPNPAPRAAPTPAFIPLGQLPLHNPPAGTIPFSMAGAISGDGSTVVGRGRSDTLASACWRWTAEEGMVEMGSFPDALSSHTCRSYDAIYDGSTVVGRAVHPDKGEAFVWSRTGGFTGLGDLGEVGVDTSEARRVSADGSVVVGAARGADRNDMAFRWTPEGGMVGLGFLSSIQNSIAYGVSADGSVIVGYSGSRAFRWTEQTGMVDIGDLPGGAAAAGALGVSGDGNVITGWSISGAGTEIFRWTPEAGMVALGDLPGGATFADTYGGISYDGNVIVGFGNTSAGDRAFVWRNGRGMQDLRSVLVNEFGLNVSGYTLREAWDVSDDGTRIVGWATGPNGTEAFLAIIPEPASAALLLLGGVAALRRARPERRTRFS